MRSPKAKRALHYRPIHEHAEHREKIGSPLHFIQDDKPLQLAKNKFRILERCIIGRILEIEYRRSSFLGNSARNSGLAALARSKQGDDWSYAKGIFYALLKPQTRYHSTMIKLENLDVNY